MLVRLDADRFAQSHQLFETHVAQKSGGVPFTSFSHPFLVDTEIQYKWAIAERAKEILRVAEWHPLHRRPGRIVERLKQVTHGNVSRNLLEHRYGMRNPDRPLYQARGDQVPTLERLVSVLLNAGRDPQADFGAHFDVLADFLRRERLGCQWTFMAYLAFLANNLRYFPILPTRFERLLQFYGNDVSLSGHVSWARYTLLLQLAELLRDRLAMYGRPNAIEVQSYMFVVAYLVERSGASPAGAVPINFAAVLSQREAAAKERERIGLLGERLIAESEKRRLSKAGRPDLAAAVSLVSVDDSSHGFDLNSFNEDGSELHIEVKTTARPRTFDQGFWLSENERRRASTDTAWRLFRVWSVDTSPEWEDLGNVVTTPVPGWILLPSSWAYRPTQS